MAWPASGPAAAAATAALGLIRGRLRLRGPPVPAVEVRVVAGISGLAEPKGAQIPVRADLARGGTQVMPSMLRAHGPLSAFGSAAFGRGGFRQAGGHDPIKPALAGN